MSGIDVDAIDAMADRAIDGAIGMESPEFFVEIVERVQGVGGSAAVGYLLHSAIIRTAQRADRGELPA